MSGKVTVNILGEAGYEFAALGLSLSYNQDVAGMPAVMGRLYNKGGGHNKFLESIIVWLDIVSTLHFWGHFDTYRVGVSPAGNTGNSQSTMHTALKYPFTAEMFYGEMRPEYLAMLNEIRKTKNLDALQRHLGKGFLQRRVITMNYRSLRNVMAQRAHHKSPEWHIFFDSIMAQIQHKEFFADFDKGNEKE